jgi:hypothetical protein
LLSSTTLPSQHDPALVSISSRTSPYIPLTSQAITQHDNHQTTLHLNPQYISESQTHHAAQLSTSIASFNANAHLPPNVLAKVVYNQVTMTPLERFETTPTYPYQQHSTYDLLPDSSYHNTSHFQVRLQPSCGQDTCHAQSSLEAGYSNAQSFDQEPLKSEHNTQPWTVGESNFAYVGTQSDYYPGTQYDGTGDVNGDCNTNA